MVVLQEGTGERMGEPGPNECEQGVVGEDKGATMVECPVCLMEKPKDSFLQVSTCHHRCCSKCLKEYFKIEIMESRLAIACPECSELFHPNDIRAIVQDDILMQKYEDFMLRRVLAMDSDTRWCPAPDCGFAVIATGCAGCPKLKCDREGCNTFFCYHCKQYWHPNQTCDAARAERSPNIRSDSVSYSQESGAQNEIKSCPRCGAFIVKMDDGSCNHMTCAVCGAGFCWLCMKEISDLHYLSPSGCTFWGRKPWSRKKKILWQLGTLVGAPIGITLVAGIAVPAMIIGIPVWVGRKIHYRFDMASKHKRNMAITGGVAASILAAPIIAGLAVGIGVPILLAYVYGVVPFSLCRSGGCGVTTTNTGGVRFEFDEQDETNPQGPYRDGGDTHSIETAPNVANPSIAPSIGDASLGMTNSLSASGSHMDRAGVLRDDSDRDSSSHRAIAGNSINGSLCSATYGAQHHKLEVQADISEHAGHCERSSVGGESYSMSLNDDASTRALAGSIVSPKDKDGISLCSRHFDGSAHTYLEESSGKEVECLSSSSGNGQQQRGSSSCPTSPHLRKASPAPSEDTRSTRGKKCTRFMDQVSEIESKSDCLSIGSMASNSSTSPSCEGAVTTVPAYSTLSLTTTTTTTQAALASCESLMSEGKADAIGAASINQHSSLSNGRRLKAESTSVLMDGADSRRCEMAGGRRKSDSTSRDDLNPAERSLGSRKKNGHAGNKEHRSQPGNLSDISEMKGMPVVSAAGCSDLLAVIDTSCENVFLDKRGQTKGRLMSASSSCSSSSDDPSDFLVSKRCCQGDKVLFEPPSTVVEDEANECCWPQSDTACSLSDVNMAETKDDEANSSENHYSTNSISLLPSTSGLKRKSSLVLGKEQNSKKANRQFTSTQRPNLAHDSGKSDSDSDKCSNSRALCKRDSCVSRTSIGSDSALAASPLPDVERPTSFFDSVTPSPRCKFTPPTSSVQSIKHSEPVVAFDLNPPNPGSLDTNKMPHTPCTTTTKATFVTFPALSKGQMPPKIFSEKLPTNTSQNEEVSLVTQFPHSHSPETKLYQSSLPLLHLARTKGSEGHTISQSGHSKVFSNENNSTDQTRTSPTHAVSLQHSSQPKPSQEDQSYSHEHSGCLYTDL